MNDYLRLLHHQHTQWPRISKDELHCNAEDVIGRRLRDYLRAMGLSDELAEHWRGRVQYSEENAIQAFSRLRSLLSEHVLEGDEVTFTNTADASVFPRIYSWIEPGCTHCALWIRSLCDTPPIHRSSMAPEGWDD